MTEGHIVVTGAAGRLGGQLAQMLADDGYAVTGTDRAELPGE